MIAIDELEGLTMRSAVERLMGFATTLCCFAARQRFRLRQDSKASILIG